MWGHLACSPTFLSPSFLAQRTIQTVSAEQVALIPQCAECGKVRLWRSKVRNRPTADAGFVLEAL